MKIGSIVAEYNPFHNGHRYQIEKYKKEKGISHVVVAMSGNFVQRGAPAVFDKFSRAEMAISGGADLVIEIPAYFATQTAEIYARGAVMSIEALKCADSICFGAEEEDTEKLKEIAEVLVFRKDEYEKELSTQLERKLPFPTARQEAVSKLLKGDCTDIMSKSNNILAIEYIKEILRIDSDIEPFSILRKGVEHNSRERSGKFRSATSIRESICSIDSTDNHLAEIEDYVPEKSLEVIKRNIEKGFYPMNSQKFFDEICYSVLRDEENLDRYFEVNEGIENSIRKKTTQSYDFNELVEELTSARYTSAKIRRSLFNILFGIEKGDMNCIKEIKSLPYVRVLAFNKRGTEILKEIKNKSDVLIIKSPAKVKKSDEYRNSEVFKKMFDFDIRTSNIYYQKYYSGNRKVLKKGEPDFITLGYML